MALDHENEKISRAKGNNTLDNEPDTMVKDSLSTGLDVRYDIPKFVVGIGASAGGIESVIELLKSIPEDSRNSYIIIQHMSPDFDTMLPEILTRQTHHHVAMITEGMTIQAGCFYLIPPSKMLTIFHGKLLLEERLESNPISFFPIDYFFESLARDFGSQAIGVILSGTGSDGTNGSKALRKNLGYIIAQTPESSKFSGMPKSVITSNLANAILPISSIYRAIEEFTSGINSNTEHSQMVHLPNKSTALDKIFAALRQHYGIDFNCYQEDLVLRRVDRRIRIIGCSTLSEYSNHITRNINELRSLYDDLLLGVTDFNRHKECLSQLNTSVFEKIFMKRSEKDPIRVWVVGCSTGEEAFTIGFLLSDYLDKNSLMDFKIFATDVDDKSLRIASRAIYPLERIKELPIKWQKNYFLTKDGQSHVRSHVRERVVFANHNVIKDPPFPAIDLITCRNLFIYLKQDIKKRIIRSFQFSLKNKGYLLLGPNEGLPDHGEAFSCLHHDVRLFQCTIPAVSYTGNRIRSLRQKVPSKVIQNLPVTINKSKEEIFLGELYSRIVTDHFQPSLIFNSSGIIEYYLGNVRELCNPMSGRASHRLIDVLPDDLYSIVNSLRNQLSETKFEASDTLFLNTKGSRSHLLHVDLIDLKIEKTDKNLFLLKFNLRKDIVVSKDDIDKAIPSALAAKIRRLEGELDQAKKELIQNRSKMAEIIGQLEASNEELRTTNEELQSGSEELQSTNEELQAVNEELYTVNAECQMRITELSEMSSDVQNIYEVSEVGTLFIDKNLRIRKFNSFSKKIFNLIPDDVGRPLEHFSSTLKINFSRKVKKVIQTVTMYQREISSIDGITYLMRIAPYRTDDLQIKGVVLVFIDITSLKKAQNRLMDIKDELDLVVQESSDIIVKYRYDGELLWGNEKFFELFSINESLEDINFINFLEDRQRDIFIEYLQKWEKDKVQEDSIRCQHSMTDGNQVEIIWKTKAKTDHSGAVKEFVSIGKLLSSH